MSNPTLATLGPDIFLIEDVLTPQHCRKVIRTMDNSTTKSAGILLNTIDNQVRHTDILQLGGKDKTSKTINQLILGQLSLVKRLLFEEYGIKFPYAEPCSILRYGPQQFYKRHVDNILLASRFQELEQGLPTRDISVVGYLNDGFEGGQTYFDRQAVSVEPKAGAVLVFPSYFSHPHQSLPVRSGTKYAFTTWLFH